MCLTFFQGDGNQTRSDRSITDFSSTVRGTPSRHVSSPLSFFPLLPFKRSVSHCAFVCVCFKNRVYCPINLDQNEGLYSRITALFKRVKISSNKNAVFIIIQPSTNYIRVKKYISVYTDGCISLRPH